MTSAAEPIALPRASVTNRLTGACVAVIRRTSTVTHTADHAILRHRDVIIGDAVVAPATSAARYAADGNDGADERTRGRDR